MLLTKTPQAGVSTSLPDGRQVSPPGQMVDWFRYFLGLCPEQDSNLHIIADTSPWN